MRFVKRNESKAGAITKGIFIGIACVISLAVIGLFIASAITGHGVLEPLGVKQVVKTVEDVAETAAATIGV